MSDILTNIGISCCYILTCIIMIPTCIYLSCKEERPYLEVLADEIQEVSESVRSWLD